MPDSTEGTGTIDTITEGTVTAPKASQKFATYLQNRAAMEGDSMAVDVANQQVDKILTAQTAEEIWDADAMDLLNGKTLVDVEQRIDSYTVHPSTRPDFATPLNVFIVVHGVRMDTGEEIVWNTGSALIIAKLRAFEAQGLLPLECVIRATTAGNGDVLKLRPIPQRAVTAQV